jgi:hypothetical protein
MAVRHRAQSTGSRGTPTICGLPCASNGAARPPWGASIEERARCGLASGSSRARSPPILSPVERSARVRSRLELSDIRVRYVTETAEAVGQLANVSRAGLFVRTREIPRLGAVVAIQFKSPVGALIDARGDVRWTTCLSDTPDGSQGFGVALHEPGRAFREFMSWLDEQSKPDDR